MVAMVSIMIFVGAFAVAAGVIVATVAPQWRRIVRLMDGHVEPAFMPLAQLATAERRIAVRRWAATPVPAAVRRLREVA